MTVRVSMCTCVSVCVYACMYGMCVCVCVRVRVRVSGLHNTYLPHNQFPIVSDSSTLGSPHCHLQHVGVGHWREQHGEGNARAPHKHLRLWTTDKRLQIQGFMKLTCATSQHHAMPTSNRLVEYKQVESGKTELERD